MGGDDARSFARFGVVGCRDRRAKRLWRRTGITMYLTRHEAPSGARWAVDGCQLPEHFDLQLLLELPRTAIPGILRGIASNAAAVGKLLPPIEPAGEVWAAGVTYLRSREAREAESTVKDVYSKVYEADRPELFFKAVGWRVVGHQMPIRVRDDSRWNVPEPELTLVVSAPGEIVGFCVGNDVSSREIEGENPLYLPQAKIYDGSCALGPGIMLAEADDLRDVPVELAVRRSGRTVFEGGTRTSQMRRPLPELVAYLRKELEFPHGAFLMTGTGVVPPNDFSLERGDQVRITIGGLTLENEVDRRPRVAKC
jgi:2-dehydro-3-deoxy-D-arabinonate dehydratase